ncbi:phage tail protein [Winslowiella sp. 2C04]|uniref:phage tail protein n=1 Tax=Winslowiella sp. 2C04 TaxID=3416179 RepID=UPI003CFB653F
MALETFTWCPRTDAEADVKHRVRKAQFGDGYAQVAGDGLNTRSQEWALNFVGDEAYIQAIREFLDRMGGIRAFQWKPPLYPLGLWRCEEYKPVALGAGKYSLDATFIQAFRP